MILLKAVVFCNSGEKACFHSDCCVWCALTDESIHWWTLVSIFWVRWRFVPKIYLVKGLISEVPLWFVGGLVWESVTLGRVMPGRCLFDSASAMIGRVLIWKHLIIGPEFWVRAFYVWSVIAVGGSIACIVSETRDIRHRGCNTRLSVSWLCVVVGDGARSWETECTVVCACKGNHSFILVRVLKFSCFVLGIGDSLIICWS